MKIYISTLFLTVLIIVQSSFAQSTSEKSFMFGHSLLDHRPPLISTPSDETTIAHWIYLLATEANQGYAATGQYGFLPQHDNLPPFAQWGYDIVPAAWDSDLDPFSDANFTNALITAGNFMQWQGPSEEYYSDPGTSPISATQTIVNWLEQNEPGINIYIYENWPDMAEYIDGQGFPPSPSELSNYYNYLDGDFHDWWIEYHDSILQSNPTENVRMIPVGPILSDLFQNTPLSTIPVTEIYEDNAPHGRASLYFLAGLTTYMATFQQQAPATFVVPNIVHPTIATNYALIVANIWNSLQAFNLPNGESRVFFNTNLPVELSEFTATKKETCIQLNWKTLSELSNLKFEIEYSLDGTNFRKIGEIAGSNTTSVEQRYSFDHKEISIGWNYYKLKQLDLNGDFKYSSTVAIEIDRASILQNYFYPNPSENGKVELLYSAISDSAITLEIYDWSGRLVLEKKRSVILGANNFSFDFSSLGTGTFLVRILGDARTKIHKLILN